MERRRFIRVPFRTPVTVISPRLRAQAEAENLSIKGAYLRTAADIEANERLWLLLQLPDETPSHLVIPGTVVRRDEHGIGIEFGPMHIDTFLALKDVVAALLDDEGRVMAELFRSVESEPKNVDQASSESGMPSQDLWDSPPPEEDGPKAA